MLTRRIIPCLDVDRGRVVKGVKFFDHVDAGDPVERARFYQDEGADELVFYDITEMEKVERLRRDFVANVSHELRTPLASIQGYSETLLDGALEDNDNNRRFLDIIGRHTLRMERLVRDLLRLARLDAR